LTAPETWDSCGYILTTTTLCPQSRPLDAASSATLNAASAERRGRDGTAAQGGA
jgi:hypothetical protein